MLLHQFAWSENQFNFTKQMLYERPKLIPKLDFKFIPRIWWIRSVCDIFVVCSNSHGYADYIWAYHNFGILPVCMIWKANSLIWYFKKSSEHFLDFWYNSFMERKIFNKIYKSRIKLDLKFSTCYWWGRSVCHISPYSLPCCITFYGSVNSFYTHLNCSVAPTCAI